MADTQTFPAFDRSMFIPLLDLNKIVQLTGFGTANGTGHYWGRIDKSEIYELQFNPQTETKAYIVSKNDETAITSYQTAMDQEIVIDGNNPIYANMYELAMKFPVGTDAEVPVLLCSPSVRVPGAIDGFLWEHALITFNSINAVDKKLSFTLNLNGDSVRGTVEKKDDGTFEFTEGEIPSAPEVQAETQASTFSTKKTTDKE